MGRRGPGRGVRGLAVAVLLALCGAPAAGPVCAFEAPSGSKNFTPPGSVPDYFSNEAAPFGRASQTATPGADRFATAPVGAGRAHASMPQPARDTATSPGRGRYRGRLAGGESGRHVASSRAGRVHAGPARVRSAHVRPDTRAASRRRVATRHRAAASRPRYAAHSGRSSRRVFR